jgi:hypothetical protein
MIIGVSTKAAGTSKAASSRDVSWPTSIVTASASEKRPKSPGAIAREANTRP